MTQIHNLAIDSGNHNVANADLVQTANQFVNVHKFGGSSLANVACIERVINIIEQKAGLNDYIVVSANGDTTDHLFALLSLASQATEDITKPAQSLSQSVELKQALTELEQSQTDLISQLVRPEHSDRLLSQLKQDIGQISQWLASDVNAHYSDILAFGELWSARLLSALLNERVCPSYFLDARDFLRVENSQTGELDYASSGALLRQNIQEQKLAVVTGYIARDKHSNTCTLGRNGSDYSATIVAALANAYNVTLWTDVDGIYSADPRVVPTARKLNRLPNAVAKELGRLGNPVLHANTLKPLTAGLFDTDHICHLHIASSFAPETVGTEVGRFGQIAQQELSITYQNDLILAKSECLLGAAGVELVENLSEQNIAIISFDASRGFLVINQAQQKQLSQHLASQGQQLTFQAASILAVVGYKVASRAQVKARFKRALKPAQLVALMSPSVISASSEHSLIAVLNDDCPLELVNRVHHKMTKHARHIGLVVAGLGNIGQCFVEQLPQQLSLPALENVHLVGLVGSTKAVFDLDGIEPEQALATYQSQCQDYSQEQLLTWLSQHPYDDLVIADITPSESFSALYHDFFNLGIHVIGANKWAASSNTDNYQKLTSAVQQNECLWLGNTTVGAALPINFSIDDLTQSGHQIEEISGIFSGTLSWLFQNYDGQQPFSDLLKQALADGLTEPDPRDDLSGKDVQRKLLILARAAGFELDLADIDCQNLVPEALQSLDKNGFLSEAQQLDQGFLTQLQTAQAQGKCLRYIAEFRRVDNHYSAKVYLAELAADHAFANLTPCDNIFQIKTQWYQSNPLIIRGPGAGREVTAAGVHSDLVTICQQLANKTQQVKIKGINQ